MRPIDGDRLLSERMKSKYYHLPNGDVAIPIIDIENAPTIEPKRDTGEWIKNTGVFNHEFEWMYYKCSNCGESMHNRLDRPNFCPNCGVKMTRETKT